jgi:hypothetical protein
MDGHILLLAIPYVLCWEGGILQKLGFENNERLTVRGLGKDFGLDDERKNGRSMRIIR